MFAFDSVPAIIAVSREPLIVYSAMMFAIPGLRTLYFVLEALKQYRSSGEGRYRAAVLHRGKTRPECDRSHLASWLQHRGNNQPVCCTGCTGAGHSRKRHVPGQT